MNSECCISNSYCNVGDKVVVTGGAGFIGSNAAERFLRRGAEVVIVDNFSRRGTWQNLEWLRRTGPVVVVNVDLRDSARLSRTFAEHRDVKLILHLGGQVAVTESISNPLEDFQVNAHGTLNVLEAIRSNGISAPMIYSSTNKVYGAMPDVPFATNGSRYLYVNGTRGISEDHRLDFHSPYACSKGAADQYVRDYHRIYGLNTVVFRQSCIYGLRQFGAEEQGWVAWFAIAAERDEPVTVFGDGKQVRDVLFVEDLLDAYEAAAANIESVAGQVFNIGGGPDNALSLNELIEYLEMRLCRPIRRQRADWRLGDQRIYVSDIRRAARAFGWRPRVDWRHGVDLLLNWVRTHQHLFCRF
jgi:CDP-paratose 2-epimerase